MMKAKVRLLITGGAGFIGSHLVQKYINDSRVDLVRVIDDFSTGLRENIEPYLGNSKFEFIEGDICNYDLCLEATLGIDKITHQAALGSVPRSIQNPMRTTEVNVLGTVNLLHACHVNNVERIIMACSSSTYGDSPMLPKQEAIIGNPLSPYAVTKYAIEVFAEVFHKVYGLNYVGLRYFNIFGPRQNPDNAYAAVIPLFCKAFLSGTAPVIYGDGETSRDFTYVENAIHANDLALFTNDFAAINQVYNVACSNQITLNEMISCLQKISGKQIEAKYGPERAGDVKHSRADISKIENLLGYKKKITFEDGLSKTFSWYSENL